MEKPARTHFITLCKRALEASNWTGFDRAHLVGDSHVVCFQSTSGGSARGDADDHDDEGDQKHRRRNNRPISKKRGELEQRGIP